MSEADKFFHHRAEPQHFAEYCIQLPSKQDNQAPNDSQSILLNGLTLSAFLRYL